MAKDSLAKASVHEPVGKKDLWKHKGWQLPAYIQHIANDLIKERGMNESRAIATAISVVKKWAAGGKNVDAGTRAAARKALAEWEALKAKAHATHASEGDWSEENSLLLAEFLEESESELEDEILALTDELEEEGGIELGDETEVELAQGAPNQPIGELRRVIDVMRSAIQRDPDADHKKTLGEALKSIIGVHNKNEQLQGPDVVDSIYMSAEEHEFGVLAEMFFDAGASTVEGDLIWKPILREGSWKLSPGPGQVAQRKPITVIKDGRSDAGKLVISMSELLANYQDGAVEHVTIPTSHDNKVDQNTGYIRQLRMGTDEKGRATLEAAHDFTEPDIKGMAERGTIANTSAGILFDFPRKEDGKKYGAVLEHVALTNKPWLSGMKPFGLAAEDERVTVLSFSEEISEGGEAEETTTEEVNQVEDNEKDKIQEAFGLSEEEIRERLSRLSTLELSDRERSVKDRIKAWEGDKKAPAVLVIAEEILLADTGAVAVNLSQDGKTTALTLSEVVERFVAASPAITLDTEQVSEEDLTKGTKPDENADRENEEANLSDEVKREARRLWFEEGKTEAEALSLAQAKFASKDAE